MPIFRAIAAMSENRAIGKSNGIPWHLPEDLKWFKRMTLGKTLLMGRKTFESLGKPLPNRTTLVLSRRPQPIPGTQLISSLDQLHSWGATEEIFVCGGAEVYQLALPYCSDLFLTCVRGTFEGDTFFPSFEDKFQIAETVAEQPEFKIVRFINPTVKFLQA